MRQIEFVATLDAIKKLSPALAECFAAEQGPYSANFPCMPADCQTALGTRRIPGFSRRGGDG
jgi:hypothetical protein